MASESFDEKSSAKKPTVQIGDPFYEKLLIESCLEVMQAGLVVAIQDMGAAGLTSSSFEMAGKGNVGLRMHLDQVPLRDSTMTPEDILLSESQERMLLICEPAKFEAIRKIFENWGLDACKVGEVTKERIVELFWKGEQLTALDPYILTEEVPHKNRPYQAWKPKNRVDSREGLGRESVGAKELLALLKDPRATSRAWVFNQYDQRVGAKTMRDCEDSVGIVRLPDSGRVLGLVVGCRPHMMRLDAREGGLDALMYPSLELASKGFEPLALTDCLNFGNPEKPEIMSEFVAAVEALNEGAKELDTPVISGNVSFYNETLGQNITSTPATGLVGLRDWDGVLPRSYFTHQGDKIAVLQVPMLETTGMWAEVKGKAPVAFGQINVKKCAGLVRALTSIAKISGISASRVVGKFGLAYALARMSTNDLGPRLSQALQEPFREVLYQIVLTGNVEFLSKATSLAQQAGCELREIGTVAEGEFDLGGGMQLPLRDINDAYHSGLEAHFGG